MNMHLKEFRISRKFRHEENLMTHLVWDLWTCIGQHIVQPMIHIHDSIRLTNNLCFLVNPVMFQIQTDLK